MYSTTRVTISSETLKNALPEADIRKLLNEAVRVSEIEPAEAIGVANDCGFHAELGIN